MKRLLAVTYGPVVLAFVQPDSLWLSLWCADNMNERRNAASSIALFPMMANSKYLYGNYSSVVYCPRRLNRARVCI